MASPGRRLVGWGARLGKPAILQKVALTPGNLVRYEHPLVIEGLPEFRRSIGLDAATE